MAPNTPAKTQISVTGEMQTYAVVLTGKTLFDCLLPSLTLIDGTEVRMETINAFFSCCSDLGSVLPVLILRYVLAGRFPLFSEEIISRVRVERVRIKVSVGVCRCGTDIFTGGERH